MNCANTMKPLRTRPRDAACCDLRRQQALHQVLIGAVRRQRQRDAAEQPGPDRVGLREVERRIETHEAPGLRADAHHFGPAAIDAIEQGDRHRAGADDVDEHLDHVGPDHRRDAAAHRVDDHRRAEDDHHPGHRHLRHDRDHERGREQPDAVGQRSRDQEDHRRQRLDARAEAALQQLVRREQIAAEVGRDEQQADEDAADDVADRELQERHVAGVGLRRNADERQRAGFGGDDREADRPPRHAAIGQEIIARGLLVAREPRPEGRDGEQVDADDEVVDRRRATRRRVYSGAVPTPNAARPSSLTEPALLGGAVRASYENRMMPAAPSLRAAAMWLSVCAGDSW